MRRSYFLLSILALASFLAGCASSAKGQPEETKTLEDYRMSTDVPEASSLTETAQTEVASLIPSRDCPVTTAGKASFEAPAPYSPKAPWPNQFWFGSEHLWTALQSDGVWSGLPHNPAGYTQKLVWWSEGYIWNEEPEPALTVTGERLGAPAPLLTTSDANGVFADDMGSAMMAGFDFPTLGCWKITGQYEKTELSFVVWLAP